MKPTTRMLTAAALMWPLLGTAAEDYLGEFCWLIDIQTAAQQVTVQVGVYARDHQRYALYGTVVESGMLLNGHAEPVGGSLRMGFTVIGTDPSTGDHSADSASATLDPATFNGSFFWTGTHRTPSGETSVHYDSGTMTLTTCPQ